ncbi:ATP-binding protein [Chitinispirillales bacterium ANBcel5]|uniref:ATP-binding protein n=1 Tax=Cellulosispirillum alkaliphilum TaxID=3039283 RepID=UPI002A51AA71|nr:ATP-binding protein [Chitinispirillales bacterium ANBcel5]
MQIDDHLFALLFEDTPVCIMILNVDGEVKFINKFGGYLFSCPKEQLIGKTLESYINSYNFGPSWDDLWQNMVKGRMQEARVEVGRGNNDDVICLVSSFNIENCPDCIALVFRDITQELKASEQIEKKNVEMAKMNTELIRSNAELKKVSELKSNFLSIASHELKTPLTSIKGYSDIIIDNFRDKLDSGIFRMIESINRAADRLHKVVNNILDVTRIEQKRLRLRPETFNLAVMANDCIEELSQFTLKRGITFKCHMESNPPSFYGDKMRMHQVFTNLFSNAIKYSPDGSPIDVYITTESENRFHIVIKDHGIGVDKAEQKNIFDPFYEVGSTNRHSTDYTKFMGGGTGLGLSIVKGIIERHGGRIWVESEGIKENSFPGSEFHVLLPIHSEISWDDDETKSLYFEDPRIIDPSELEEEQELMDEEVSILLIDSDREAVEIARMVLESAFDIHVAESGELGLLYAFEKRPSIILMDSYLPGLDGYRICRILRSQEETRNIPIAFFSAGTQNDEIQKCFASGADDFIVKPFSGRELVDKIWRLLMKKKEEETFK